MASLNQFISNINHEVWHKNEINTNNAKAAHTMVNREGKQLGLLSVILRLVYFFLIVNLSLILLTINNF